MRKPLGKSHLAPILSTLLVVALFLVAAGGRTSAQEPLIFAEPNWDSVQLQNRIAMFIVEHGYGYSTETVFGSVPALWQGLRNGEIDLMMEAWLPNQQELWDKAMAEHAILDVGKSLDDNWQSMFVVPSYVIEGDPARGIAPMAPDLKSYQDIRRYRDLFTDVESRGEAILWTCIAGWACEEINAQKLEVYGLENAIELRNPGSATALFASVTAAYEKGEPWLGYMWGPTKTAAELDLTILEEPECAPGKGPETGCAYPTAEVKIVAHVSLEERASEIIDFLEKWDFDAATQVAAEGYMADTGATIEETAIWFLKNQEAVWSRWVPASVAQKVKDALNSM